MNTENPNSTFFINLDDQMTHWPEEVLEDILSRLPVKSLLRFRSVSKPWRSLIGSSHFVKLHLNRSIESKTDCSLILMADQLHLLDFGFHDGQIEPVNINLQQLGFDDGFIRVWGPCNGLVCLSKHDLAVLWNPATRKLWRLPYEPVEPKFRMSLRNELVETKFDFSDGGNWVYYGIGYDSANDDYKVVRIAKFNVHRYDEPVCMEFKVYSLKSNSWHTAAEEFPHFTYVHGTLGQSLVNGALHWVVSRHDSRSNLIMAFNLSSEKFKIVPDPVDYWSDNIFGMIPDSLGGCLAGIGNYYGMSQVDIWVMKDYGVRESWTKLLSVNQLGECTHLRPLACSNSGSQILLEKDQHELLWYDMERKTFRYLEFEVVDGLFHIGMSVGSLVPVRGGDEDVKAEQVTEKKTAKRKLIAI